MTEAEQHLIDVAISHDELKSILEYDPHTGKFTWLETRGGTAWKGSVAGADNGDGYITIMVKKRAYLAHRLAVLYMTGELPEKCVDHINGVEGDNRWENLRCVTHGENMKNQRRRRTNVSGVTGVSWHKVHKKWTVKIANTYLGIYACFDDAVRVRRDAERLHGYTDRHGRSA